MFVPIFPKIFRWPRKCLCSMDKFLLFSEQLKGSDEIFILIGFWFMLDDIKNVIEKYDKQRIHLSFQCIVLQVGDNKGVKYHKFLFIFEINNDTIENYRRYKFVLNHSTCCTSKWFCIVNLLYFYRVQICVPAAMTQRLSAVRFTTARTKISCSCCTFYVYVFRHHKEIFVSTVVNRTNWQKLIHSCRNENLHVTTIFCP